MNVFKKIGQLLLGETENCDTSDKTISDTPNSSQTAQDDNAVNSRLKIKKMTLALLDSLYLMDSERCKSKRIVVWFDTDNTTFNAYSGFEQDLKEYWSVESGYIFENVILKLGRPERDGRKIDVNIEALDIYLQEKIDTTFDGPIVKKASISIFGNKGSLLNSAIYELSNEILEKEHRKFYNIGRGEFPDMDGGGYRQNHIVIDDKNNLEINKYVSRAHARIGYSDNIGFYLQVEYGGSRLSGNRTRIFRGEGKAIEVENIDVKEPLLNGDLIELGKAVVLQFVESN